MLFAAEAGSTMLKDRTEAAATTPKNRANPKAAYCWLLGGSDAAIKDDDDEASTRRPAAS